MAWFLHQNKDIYNSQYCHLNLTVRSTIFPLYRKTFVLKQNLPFSGVLKSVAPFRSRAWSNSILLFSFSGAGSCTSYGGSMYDRDQVKKETGLCGLLCNGHLLSMHGVLKDHWHPSTKSYPVCMNGMKGTFFCKGFGSGSQQTPSNQGDLNMTRAGHINTYTLIVAWSLFIFAK